VDETLFTALAKGADQAIKLAIDQTTVGTVAAARTLATFLTGNGGLLTSDTVVLTGSQAIDDLEGELGPCLADLLNLPFLGVITGLTIEDDGKRR